MILEYEYIYKEVVKDLLFDLGKYVASIDREGYNIVSSNYRDDYFNEVMGLIEDNDGKMFLYGINNRIVGMVVALVNNEEYVTYDFQAPKRGRIQDLSVIDEYRDKGIGKILITAAEDYLKSIGCKSTLIGVFSYNSKAKNFYISGGYKERVTYLEKKLDEE